MQEPLLSERFEYEWACVSIKPQNVDYELPMEPITMWRNALGVGFGGSGVPLNFQNSTLA